MRTFSMIISVLAGLLVIGGGFVAMSDPAAEFDPMTAFGIGIALLAFGGYQWYMRKGQGQ